MPSVWEEQLPTPRALRPCRLPIPCTPPAAGHDTSSTTLARTLWRLANSPGSWAALVEEQRRLAAAEAAAGRGLDGASLRAMPYTEAVIKWAGYRCLCTACA